MTVLIDGSWDVHYGQLYLESQAGRQQDDMADHFRGQANGLAGATVSGAAFLLTGLHTGPVGLRVERHDDEPALDDVWEDVVEVSVALEAPVRLVGWGGEREELLDVPTGGYRLRWAGRDLQRGSDEDTIVDDKPLDRSRRRRSPLSAPALARRGRTRHCGETDLRDRCLLARMGA